MYMCMVTNWSLDGRFAINNSRRLILRESVHLTTVPPEQYINLSNPNEQCSCKHSGLLCAKEISLLPMRRRLGTKPDLLPFKISYCKSATSLIPRFRREGPVWPRGGQTQLTFTTEVKLLDFGYCKVESSSGFFYDCPQPWNLDLKTGALLGKSRES